jgi:hypothetical protein
MTERKRMYRTDPSVEAETTADTAASHTPAPFRIAIPMAAPLTGSTADLADPFGGTEATQEITSVLRRRRGQGRALPPHAVQRFGEAYGSDLSGVRVHTDGESDHIARSVQATAFTHGSDVYFSAGSYAPTSSSGERLLAHELAHVAQHQKGEFGRSGGGTTIGRANDPAEAAADGMAASVLGPIRRTPNTRTRGEPVEEWQANTRPRQGAQPAEELDSLKNYVNPKKAEDSKIPAKARKLLGIEKEEEFVGTPVGKFSGAPSADKRSAVAEIRAQEKEADPKKNTPHQPVADLGEIYAHSSMLKAEYEHQVQEIAAATGGKTQFRPGAGMKSLGRTLEKITTDYKGDASRIVDVTGGSIYYDSPDELIEGYKAIDSNKLLNVARVKNSLAKASGYGDVNLALEMGSADFDIKQPDGSTKTEHYAGFIIELQLHLTPIIKAKSSGHKQYEEQRQIVAKNEKAGKGKDPANWSVEDSKRNKELEQEMKTIYDTEWKKLISWRDYIDPRIVDKLQPLRDKLAAAIKER